MAPVSPRYALLLLDVHGNADALSSRSLLPESLRDQLADVASRISVSAFAANMIVLDVRTGRATEDHGKIVLHEGTKPVPTFRLEGAGSDAFAIPTLAAFLRRGGAGHLFLAGGDAVDLVNKTGRSALARGFRVTFIRDAIFTCDDFKWGRLLRGFESDAALAMTSDQFMEFALALEKQ